MYASPLARRRLRHRRLQGASTPTTARSRTSARSSRPAHQRGIRVIADLVMNHTSSDHPWFQESRSAPDSPKRNWYVWSDDPTRYPDARDHLRRQRALQLDLGRAGRRLLLAPLLPPPARPQLRRAAVQEAMLDVLRFWLDLGLDGFRLDAVPYLLRARRHQLREPARDARLPASACGRRSTPSIPTGCCSPRPTSGPQDVVEYFGDGDECHMAFHFPVMPRMFMALRREEAAPILEILEQTPADPRQRASGACSCATTTS